MSIVFSHFITNILSECKLSPIFIKNIQTKPMPNQDDIWPQPSFYFKVIFPSLTSPVLFQQLSGLEGGPQDIEHRQGNTRETNVKVTKPVNGLSATLHRGIFINDGKFSEWYSKIGTHTTGKENVVIQLLDQNGKPSMFWTLINAWPTSITGNAMKPEDNEAAIEKLELAYEVLTVNGG
jgi:phage tail-like protein